nr:retrovirus-related Pol polyprotein from transposon TNT 1-94 [Tanacetum cinerariifolium]
MEEESLDQTKLEDVGLTNHNISLSSRELPSFDEPGPQPQPLPSFSSLDVSLGDERRPEPPNKPWSPDSFRMKVVDSLTIYTLPSPHVASFHPKDISCYYHPCVDDPKKHYRFKPVTIPAVPATDDTLAVPERTTTAHKMWIAIERLQQEWSRFVTIVKQQHDLDTVSYHKLFDVLKQYQKEVNEICAEKIANNVNPLALIAAALPYPYPYYQASKSHKTYAPTSKQSYFTRSNASTKYKGKEIAKQITPPSESAFEEDNDPEQAQRDKDMQKNLALIAKETVGSQVVQKTGIQCFFCKEFGHFAKECRKPKRVKDSTYYKEKMLLCKQAESNTCVVEKVDSNVIPDSPDMCDNDIQTDQNAEDECAALANLIAKFKLDVDKNKKIQKQSKKVNTSLDHELKEYKSILAETSRTLRESNSIRDSCLIALQNKQTGLEMYKTLNDRTLELCKEKASNVLLKEREQYFEIQDLKAQLQDKNIAISELKKLIEKCHGKSMETKFDKPYVVRQSNAQRIPKPSVLGKPTPFSDSLERKSFSKTKSVPKTNVPEGLSKSVATHNLPQTARQAVKNTNLRSTQMKDKVVPNNSQVKLKKTEVEDHHRISSISNKTKSVTACIDSLKSRTSNVNVVCATCGKCVFNLNHDACVFKFLNDVNARNKKPKVVPISTRKLKSQANKSVATPSKKTVASESTIKKSKSCYRMLYEKTINSGCTKHMTGNLKLLCNFVEKDQGTVRFDNDQFALILGYGDLVQGNITFSKVYYVEGLNHNLFSVGQFCDADLEVAFWKSTYFVRDLQGNDLCNTPILTNIAAKANLGTKKHTVVPISTRKAKSQANKLIVTPNKKKVASKSTKQKQQSYFRVLYENTNKAWKWWIEQQSPSRYKWVPKIKKQWVPKAKMQWVPKAKNDQIVQLILFIVDSGCTKHMTGNLKLLCNFVEKVYYVKGLNHNLFSVGQFCDADLEVAFRKSTCFVRDLQGNDLPVSNRGSDLYTISLQESTSTTPLCLMAKATPTQAWLWNRRLYHLNFDYISLLSKKDIVIGLPKLKGTKFLNKTLNAFFKEEGIKHQTSTARTPEQNGVVERRNRTLKALDYDNPNPVSQIQDVYSSADADVPSQQELDLLFGPLFEEFFNAGSNPSTKIPSTSAPSIHTNVHATENNNDQAEEGEQLQDDEFTNPFCAPAQEEAKSSSYNIGNSNVPTFNQPIVFEYRWRKDHQLEQVCGNPSRPIQTRRQLATDPKICMYALIVSTAKPKNIKEAMVDSAWIEAMQEELHQFDRLQSQELKTVSYHKLYDILKQHQHEVNEIRAEKIVRVANLLALVAQQQPVYHPPTHPTHYNQNFSTRSQQLATRNRGKAIINSPRPIYDQEPSMVDDDDDDETSKDKEIDKLMALISLSFKKIYKPTNNNLQTSSNIANQDNSPRINRNAGYESQRSGNVAEARENVGSSMVQNSGIQCYNCKEYGHVARECQKPKRAKHAAYHREKMLLCNQEEAGIQLNAEQADWKDNTDDKSDDQELEAHYMYMAKIQEVSPDVVDSGPIFDTEPEQKVQNDDHYDVFAIECQHPEQSESVHKTYLIEQDAHNVIIESVDMNYDSESIDQNDEDVDLAKE